MPRALSADALIAPDGAPLKTHAGVHPESIFFPVVSGKEQGPNASTKSRTPILLYTINEFPLDPAPSPSLVSAPIFAPGPTSGPTPAAQPPTEQPEPSSPRIEHVEQSAPGIFQNYLFPLTAVLPSRPLFLFYLVLLPRTPSPFCFILNSCRFQTSKSIPGFYRFHCLFYLYFFIAAASFFDTSATHRYESSFSQFAACSSNFFALGDISGHVGMWVVRPESFSPWCGKSSRKKKRKKRKKEEKKKEKKE
jgi:hypothetical protein